MDIIFYQVLLVSVKYIKRFSFCLILFYCLNILSFYLFKKVGTRREVLSLASLFNLRQRLAFSYTQRNVLMELCRVDVTTCKVQHLFLVQELDQNDWSNVFEQNTMIHVSAIFETFFIRIGMIRKRMNVHNQNWTQKNCWRLTFLSSRRNKNRGWRYQLLQGICQTWVSFKKEQTELETNIWKIDRRETLKSWNP